MNSPDAQALVFQLDVLVPLYPAVFLEIVVELLDLDGRQLIKLDVTQLGNDVLVDVIQVVVLCFSRNLGSA